MLNQVKFVQAEINANDETERNYDKDDTLSCAILNDPEKDKVYTKQ